MRPPEHPAEERITFQRFSEQLLELLNLERGLGYTLQKLIIDPYAAIREYLFEDRRRMVKPLPLLLLLVGITTFLSFQFLHLDTEVAASGQNEEVLSQLPEQFRGTYVLMTQFITQYFNLALISALPFMALASFLLFRKQQLYYTEHLVINAYIYSVQTLFVLPFLPFILSAPLATFALLILSNTYLVYAFKSIFEQSWWNGIIKSIAVYILGQIGYNLFLVLVVVVLSLFV